MNQVLRYNHNANGRMFSDVFSDLRKADPTRFFPGQVLEVYLNGMQMGSVTVRALKTFRYDQIKDSIAYIICGKPAYYLAAMMKKFYDKEEPVTAESEFTHLVLQWTARNLEAHGYQLELWWKKLQEVNSQNQHT